MTGHPCAAHIASCDHCFCCEVLKVCCASISTEQRAQLEADDRTQRDRLRAAIAKEAGTVPSLGELVRVDAERQRPARLLPKPSPLGLPRATAERIPHDSRKEARHVIPARSTR
jgi:hypothetical protein